MLSDSLSGKAALWKPFWLLYVLGFVGIEIVFSFLGSRVFAGIWLDAGTCPPHPFRVILFESVVWNLYALVAWVAIWRCAFNTRYRALGYLARLVVVANVIYLAFRWFVTVSILSSPEGQQILESFSR